MARAIDPTVGDGLLVVDKPAGWTSHQVVGACRRLAGTRKVGHAGTLDPMATGVLVVGVNKATRLLTYLVGCDKAYAATIRLGQSTLTDDADGELTAQAPRGAVEALLAAGTDRIETAVARLTGDIVQVPSAVSAIKIDGKRSYARVRAGEDVALAGRPVTVSRFDVLCVRPDADGTVVDLDVEVEVSSGTYVRALARDLGRLLGCYGHVTALRRTRVGPFTLDDATPLAALDDPAEAARALKPVESGLTEVPCVVVDRNGAARLRRGQGLLLRGRDAPDGGFAWASCGGEPVAFGEISEGELRPSRVFNLGG